MRIAEALILRADMKKKIDSMRERMKGNCLVQEGESPHEPPQKLIEESFRVLQEQEQLVCRINLANNAVKLSDGRTMMQAIAQRDRMTAQHALLKTAIESCTGSGNYYSHSEIKWKSVLKVAGLQKQADDLALKIRELNVLIQETNWLAELPE